MVRESPQGVRGRASLYGHPLGSGQQLNKEFDVEAQYGTWTCA